MVVSNRKLKCDNRTGINLLSVDKMKNSNGCLLKRYRVSYYVDNVQTCHSFYFGVRVTQRNAFKIAVQFMIDQGLYEYSLSNALRRYRVFEHEGLV